MKKQFNVLKTLLVVLTVLWGNAQAKKPENFKCHTPNEEKVFTIGSHKVTFHHDDAFKRHRAISSTSEVSARTLNTHEGFTKVLYVNSHKHRIHIKNLAHMNEVDDYLTIVSPRGHTMTYPINCQIL